MEQLLVGTSLQSRSDAHFSIVKTVGVRKSTTRAGNADALPVWPLCTVGVLHAVRLHVAEKNRVRFVIIIRRQGAADGWKNFVVATNGGPFAILGIDLVRFGSRRCARFPLRLRQRSVRSNFDNPYGCIRRMPSGITGSVCATLALLSSEQDAPKTATAADNARNERNNAF